MLAISLLSGLAFILIFTMICTLPSWIAGKIMARRTRAMNLRLTTPGRGHSLTRWALLMTAGFLTLSFFALATTLNTQAGYDGNYLPVILAGVAAAAFAAISHYLAFTIGFTATTTTIARRRFENDHQARAVNAEEYESTAKTEALPVLA